MYRYFYNPSSRGNKGEKSLQEVINLVQTEEYESYNILEYGSYDELFTFCELDDKIVIIGGDGTIHRFVNEVAQTPYEVYFYAGGTGNDFMREFDTPLVRYSDYIDQPKIITDHVDKMVNGFATGIDVEVLTQYQLQKSHTKLAYLKLALKNFFSYQPKTVRVQVDGKEHKFEQTYITVVQNGTAFGGGMKVTPLAKNNDGLLDICVVHNITPWKLLVVFPTVYLGKHLRFHKHVFYAQGKEVVIHVDEPTLYSSDGEVSKKKVSQFKIVL